MASIYTEQAAASSQLSSILSDPPASPSSDQETLGEITVDFHSTTISPRQSSHQITSSSSPRSSSKMARKKPTMTNTQPTRQSQRQTRKPSFFEVPSSEDELSKEVCSASVPAKRGRANSITNSSSRKPNSKPAKRAKPTLIRGAKRWEPEFVTQNAKSPLVTGEVDLRTLLLQPAAWDVLSPEDQQEILALMPSETHILNANTPNARPNIGALVNNDTFRHDAEQYVSNISRGMHDPGWLKDAWAAHQRRTVGDFDEFYIRKIEVDWSADIPDEHRPEHLRGKKKCGASASAEEKQTTTAKAAVTGQDGSEPKDATAQSGSVKDEEASLTGGDTERPAKRKTSHDASSITPTAERYSKSNGGPRFAPILDDIDVEYDADPKSAMNGSVNGTTNGMIDVPMTVSESTAGFEHSETKTAGA